jgi:hypothetical protein
MPGSTDAALAVKTGIDLLPFRRVRATDLNNKRFRNALNIDVNRLAYDFGRFCDDPVMARANVIEWAQSSFYNTTKPPQYDYFHPDITGFPIT